MKNGTWQTLEQLSQGYEHSARLLRQQLRRLRRELGQAEEPEEIWHLRRRIAALTPVLTEMNELAQLTKHYYDRGYHRNEKYTL